LRAETKNEPRVPFETSPQPSIAFFVSPHGYGHAARACALMEAVHRRAPEIRFDVYTLVPGSFFEESLSGPFTYFQYLSDIGMAQKGPLRPDPEATVRRLDRIFPLDPRRLQGLVSSLKARANRLVLCDISPLGLFTAREAKIPSVLIENFTWDWIYEEYAHVRGMKRHSDYLRGIFEQADHRIQTDPVCRPLPGACRVPPMSRPPRDTAPGVRKRLGLPQDRRSVLITLGGVPGTYDFLERLPREKDVSFIIPGASETVESRDNLFLLPRQSEFYHPDLVHAVDAVVGKAGYSTLAEVYMAGAPFGYVLPEGFRESSVLRDFIQDRLPCLPVPEERFADGSWLDSLPDILALPRSGRRNRNGAEDAAEKVLGLLREQ